MIRHGADSFGLGPSFSRSMRMRSASWTSRRLAAIAVLPCMPLAYYTHDPSQIVRCPPYQTKQPLTDARIRAPENVFKWWAGETHLLNMCPPLHLTTYQCLLCPPRTSATSQIPS